MRAIVLHSNTYDFQNEKDGKKVSGLKLSYIFTDGFTSVENEDGSKGYPIAKANLPIEREKLIQDVPGLYDLDFSTKVNSKGQVEMKLNNVEFVGGMG